MENCKLADQLKTLIAENENLEKRIQILEHNTTTESVLIHVIENKPKTCETCTYFEQHYARAEKSTFLDAVQGLDGKFYYKINCGHCLNSRVKDKDPYSKACINYKAK